MAEHGIFVACTGRAGWTHDEPAVEERRGGSIWGAVVVMVCDVAVVGAVVGMAVDCRLDLGG